MSDIKLSQFVSDKRLRPSDKKNDDKKHRPPYVVDADRIIFSDPFRRLAHKTQVHPLYEDDHIHTRLTHSLEVAQVGASLARKIYSSLPCEHKDGLDEGAFVGAVYAACLAHDIGNPPFGHSGEETIREFFKEYSNEHGDERLKHDAALRDLCCFEGNAQGFRIIAQVEMYEGYGFDLTTGTLGAFVKYPYGSDEEASACEADKYRKQGKYGFFESERSQFQEVVDKLGLCRISNEMQVWQRSPLVYIVEAADDICYKFIDIEDGYRARILSEQKVLDLLKKVSGVSRDSVSAARSKAIGKCVDECAKVFIKNLDQILSGDFGLSKGLLGNATDLRGPLGEIKKVTNGDIFTHSRKVRLEVQGRNTLRVILSELVTQLEELKRKGWKVKDLPNYAKQLFLYCGFNVHKKNCRYGHLVIDSDENALRAAADFVSGMTDRFAVRFAGTLRG